MKLYVKVDRIHAELRALGFVDGCPLTVNDLKPLDNYNYLGTLGCDDAISALRISAKTRVLEIGSGIGGPSRYIANSTGCRVVALELQPDMNETAAELTTRCTGSLGGSVEHVCGDVLDGVMRGQNFDTIISILCFLHIPDRNRLFSEINLALKTHIAATTKESKGGGEEPEPPLPRMYIEDFVLLREPTNAQWAGLKTKVLCSYLPTMDEYRSHLEFACFKSVEITDLTGPWTKFVVERLGMFRDRRVRHVELHGEEVTAGLEDFYAFISEMFSEGIVGGVRVVAS